MQFSKDFFIGAATAAHQVEGQGRAWLVLGWETAWEYRVL